MFQVLQFTNTYPRLSPAFIGHVICWSSIMFVDMCRCDTLIQCQCSQEGEQSKIQFNILKSDFHLPKKFLFTSIKALKNDKKCFLFYAKSSFRSWDIYIFVLNFGYGKKLFDKKAIQNFWCHRLDNKQKRCTYHPISEEVKAIKP